MNNLEFYDKKLKIDNILSQFNSNIVNQDMIDELDVLLNKCSIIYKYPYMKCSTCDKYSHVSKIISNKGLCDNCDQSIYKKYSYDSKLVESNRPEINLHKLKCQRCGLLDQSLPGTEPFFCKLGELYYNYCNDCFNLILKK